MVCCFSPRISRITSIHHFQLAGFGNNIIYLYYYLGLKPFSTYLAYHKYLSTQVERNAKIQKYVETFI